MLEYRPTAPGKDLRDVPKSWTAGGTYDPRSSGGNKSLAIVPLPP